MILDCPELPTTKIGAGGSTPGTFPLVNRWYVKLDQNAPCGAPATPAASLFCVRIVLIEFLTSAKLVSAIANLLWCCAAANYPHPLVLRGGYSCSRSGPKRSETSFTEAKWRR